MNIERRTSNNDVALLLKLFQHRIKNQYRTLSSYFCFFSAVLIFVTKILINSSVSSFFSFNIRCWTFDVRCSSFVFFFFHSTFDVGRSTCPQCLCVVLVECPGVYPVTMIMPPSFVMHGRRVLDVHCSFFLSFFFSPSWAKTT